MHKNVVHTSNICLFSFLQNIRWTGDDELNIVSNHGVLLNIFQDNLNYTFPIIS